MMTTSIIYGICDIIFYKCATVEEPITTKNNNSITFSRIVSARNIFLLFSALPTETITMNS